MPPSKKFALSNEIVTALINEIKTNGECIWNTDDERYNDRFHVISFWRELSKTMGLPEELLKARWKNLRDLFKREEKRFHVQTLEEYRGKWRHFRSMWFIHKPKDYYASIDNERSTNDNEDHEEEFVGAGNFKFEPLDTGECEVFIDDPIDPMHDKRRKYDDDDYDIMFLKSLMPYFRQLEPMRKLVIRNRIQDMLMNEIAAQTTVTNLSSK